MVTLYLLKTLKPLSNHNQNPYQNWTYSNFPLKTTLISKFEPLQLSDQNSAQYWIAVVYKYLNYKLRCWVRLHVFWFHHHQNAKGFLQMCSLKVLYHKRIVHDQLPRRIDDSCCTSSILISTKCSANFKSSHEVLIALYQNHCAKSCWKHKNSFSCREKSARGSRDDKRDKHDKSQERPEFTEEELAVPPIVLETVKDGKVRLFVTNRESKYLLFLCFGK